MRLTFNLFLLGFLLTGCLTFQPVPVSTPTIYKPATVVPTYADIPTPTTTPTVKPPEVTINSSDNQIYLEGFSSSIKSLVWSKDGKTLIIGDTYNGIVFFDVENKNITVNPLTPIWEIALSRDKTTLSITYGDQMFASSKVSFVNIETGDVGKTIKVEKTMEFIEPDGITHIVNNGTGAIFSPDGKTFVLNNGKQITLWDIASGKQIKELIKSEDSFLIDRLFLNPAKNSLLAIFRNMKSWKDSDKIVIWDTNTWELKITKKIDWMYSSLSFSPDGDSFATIKNLYAQNIQEINIWNFDTFTKSMEFTNLDEPIDLVVPLNIITYDPSGEYIAIGGINKVNIYHASTGKLIRHIVTGSGIGSGSISILAFSPDGKKLAVGGHWVGQVEKVQVMIWDWNQP